MDDGPNWKRFQKIRLNRKDFSRRARKAEGATIRHAHKFIITRLDNMRSVRRHVILWMVCVGLLIGLVGLQMLWFQKSYLTDAPVKGGVFAEGVKGPVSTLNPLFALSGAELAASHLLFSSLYDYDAGGYLRGSLASATTVDQTGREYTVTLRKGVKWHDGANLTAKDVAFTTQLMKDPATRAVPALRVAWKDTVVTVIDDHTIKFALTSPNAAFPQALTFAVLPQHILKNVAPQSMRENSFSNAPVGSGPFQLKLLQLVNEAEGRKIVHMSAFPNYYRGEPKLSRFQLHIYGSDTAITNALRTGEVSAATDINTKNAMSVDTSEYDIISKPVNSGVYALLNTTQPILKDKKVRQALQIGTDTAALRKNVSTTVRPLDLPFVSGQLTGDGIPAAPAFDLARASALLDQAGWIMQGNNRVKEGQPLRLRIVTIKDGDYERTLELLASQWRKLGVVLDTEIVDTNDPSQDFTQRTLQLRDFDVLVNRLAIGSDPDVYAYWHSSQASALGKNYSNYSNGVSDDSLTSALSRSDPELRNAKYKSFARQWLDDAPAIGLYQANMYYVKNKASQAMADDEKIVSPADRYGGVIYWTVEKGMVYKTP